MKYFLTVLLGVAAGFAGGAGASAQVAGNQTISDVFAQRAVESVSGQLADLRTGALPPELGNQIPLPRAQLLGSAVFTPLQYYGQFGSRGSLEIFYDTAGVDLKAYAVELEKAGWLVHGPPGSATLYCRANAPSVIVITGPRPTSMRLSISRNHAGVDPCAAK